MPSEEDGKIISNGWKAAFITEAIGKGSKFRNPLDPFYEVDLLINEVKEMFEVIPANKNGTSSFFTQSIDDCEGK